MTAEKGNKVYTIDENLKSQYQNEGFDIKDADGNVIAYGKGKMVQYDDFAKLTEENKMLKDRIKELDAAKKELDALKAEKKPAGKKAGE